MINFEEHSASELLTLYLDGELSDSQSIQFEEILNNDEDLQMEMQDQLAIREAINKDEESFNTPAAATTAVFGALGIDQAVLSGAATTAISSGVANGILGSKLILSIIAGISIVAISVTSYMMFSDNEDETPKPAKHEQRIENISNSSIANEAASPTIEEVPIVESKQESSANVIDQRETDPRPTVTAIQNNVVNATTVQERTFGSNIQEHTVIPVEETQQVLTEENTFEIPFIQIANSHNYNIDSRPLFNDSFDESILLSRHSAPQVNTSEWKSHRVYFNANPINPYAYTLSYSYNNVWVPYIVDYIKLDGVVISDNGVSLGGAILAGKRISTVFGMRPFVEYGVGYNLIGTNIMGLFGQLNGGFEIPVTNFIDINPRWTQRIPFNGSQPNALSGPEIGIIVKF